MAGEDKKGTDGTSIKPVSSLLSHFEGLGQSKQPPSGASSPKDFTRPTKNGDNLEVASSPFPERASLDLPRSGSHWDTGTSGTLRQDDLPMRSRTPVEQVQRASTPGKPDQRRPMSMNIQSSPQLTPSVTIESPRSPPKSYFSSRNGKRSPDRLTNTLPYGLVQNNVSNSSSVASTQPGTPRVGPVDTGKVEGSRNLQRFSNLPGQSGIGPPKSSSVPPPVNRADKPKIPPKPQVHINAQDLAALAPASQKHIADDKVSPFSTPPSSDGSPSPERTIPPPKPARDSSRPKLNPQPGMDTVIAQPSGPGHQETHNATRLKDPRQWGFRQSEEPQDIRDPRTLGFSTHQSAPRDVPETRRVPPPEPRKLPPPTAFPDARELGFSNSKTPSRPQIEERRGSTPNAGSVSRRLPPSHQDARDLGFGSRRATVADDDEERPGLPPRRTGTEPPPRPPTHLKNAYASRIESPSRGLVNRSTKPSKSTQPIAKIPAQDSASRFPPPPKRNSVTAETAVHNTSLSASRGRHPSQQAIHSAKQAVQADLTNDSDEAEEAAEETPTFRSEYPDASQANRRPPVVKDGLQSLSTKFDTRMFDVCGQYVCCTGYQTRVWDISSNENTMSISHGETVKVLSVVFKPSMKLEDEGQVIWTGNNIGDLHEIDVKTQAVMATNTSHNRREVVKLHRHKRDIWSLDEDGKLFVWPADETGSPNLNYSHSSHKVPKGHTFSMVIHDQLWYASGKEIRIFQPGRDASFQVLQRPLSQSHAGDINSGTWTTKQGGRAYFGHTDGKVTVYSTKDYSCVANIKASDYMVKAMTFVGNWLWAAFKTGKIYVYDTTTSPWKVKKDWKAHDGPVAGIVMDPRSIWTLNRFQVASLGHDNTVCFWDGTLEDDWLESEMQSLDVEYCTFREIKAAVITWNVGAATPIMIRNNEFIADAIHAEDPPEILVFGFQEVVDLEDRAVTAKSILGFGHKKKDNASAEHISRVYREWRDHLKRCIDRYMGLKVQYMELHTSNLVGLFSCVFVRHDERGSIQNLSAAEVKCGLKGHYGNKGALITRFNVDDSSLCFINCHLAAGQAATSHRNYDIATILEAESLPAERDADVRSTLFVGGGDGTQILDHEICVLNGDLNYRIDAMPRDTVVNFVRRNELEKLLERDQIMVSRRRVAGFRLSPFTEAPITFAPTYKYDVGTDNYDTSEKRRSPAWCDRLLYRGMGRIKQIEYRRHEVRVSDHRPVSGTFKMRVKTINKDKQVATKKKCHSRFAEVRRRLASEASIEYLVDGLGLAESEARTMISKP